MQTLIITLDPQNSWEDKKMRSKIKIAAEVLRRGGLVAFPTETVYGLGANALDSKAVKKIFEVKGRPTDNPLIVHVASKAEVYKLASEVPKEAEKLMNAFWPGPLTLILKKSEIVPNTTTGGLDTVAIRMPAHKIALTLIKESKVPVAAPSANLSGKPSPTSGEHVIRDLYGKIDVIIDAGETQIGLESTVLDLTVDPPTILRPGGITLEDLERLLGEVQVHPAVEGRKVKTTVKSPGMKYRHYAPNADVIVVEGNAEKVREKIRELTTKYKREGKKVGVMITDMKQRCGADVTKIVGNDFETIARNLFKTLRGFDEEDVDVIIAEGIESVGLGLAIMNRLKRASYKIIKA